MGRFRGCTTVNDVKGLYRSLLFELHPDRHDASEFAHWNRLTQELNAEYHDALRNCHGETSKGDDGKDHTYYYRRDTEQTLIDKLSELIHADLPDAIVIWLVGTWIWIEGTRREDTATQTILKSLGCRWHGQKRMWYFRLHPSRHSGRSFEQLKNIFGAEIIERERETRQAIGA